ncbi:hypothetical protein [Planctomicrobium sp. SH527]|uniref:hypothetical protein n=1 Tax=Planctomicrobium sp. SH527 TaxID=3448123 RepID=UPI003F5C454C
MTKATPVLCLLVVSLWASSQASAKDVIDIGSRRELFVDKHLIESLSGGASLRLHQPTPQEVVISHDESWEGTGCGYHSIFKDGSKFRMYYKAWHLKTLENGIAPGDNYFTCYAESDDGIKWTKPNLGLHEIRGSKQNNVILVREKLGPNITDPAHISMFKDENPECAPDAVYKAIVMSCPPTTSNGNGLLPFKSADGIHWKPMSDVPVITDGAFDSQNLAFWDPVRKEYRAYWRYFKNSVRDIKTATSKDFVNWSKPIALTYPGAASEHLYVNQVAPYYRAPHLLIGFPVRYTERQTTESLEHLPDYEHRQKRQRTSQRYGTAITDCLLMASRDGVEFHRWAESFLRPGIQRTGTWNYGQQYIAWHAIETPSSLPGAPPELSLYATEDYWLGEKGSKLRRYTLRLDGFVSVNAPMSGGEIVTKPLTFSGKQFEINFSSSAAGGLQVELQDANGKPIEGFALSDCPPIYGDQLDRPVSWKNGGDVSSLAGKPVKIRFVLNDADLYSFRFIGN